MYPDNRWYGHRFILSRYAKTEDKPTICSIQHGFLKNISNKNFGKILSPYSKYLIWNEDVARICRKNKNYKFEIIGSPFLYLCKLLEKKKYLKRKNSYFVFLPHAAENIPSSFSHILFIKYIKKKFSGNITACFFYSDITNKISELYKKNEIKIFSCGQRNNKNYLDLLYKQIMSNENIVITELSSALFYSLFLNKKTYFIEKFASVKVTQNIKLLKIYKKKNYFLFEGLPKNKIVNSKLGKKLADYELGLKYIKNPYELKNILWKKSLIQKVLIFIFTVLLYLKWRSKLIK
jgi:hypothetical protein